MSLLISCMLAVTGYAIPINQTNAGNSVLDHFSNHGDPNLVCTPSTKVSIVLFLFTNYLAHCATVVSYPGETGRSSGISGVLALFFPASGIIKAMNALIRRPRLFGKNEVETATRAGALVMVVRDEQWKPKAGDEVYDVKFKGSPHSPPNPKARSTVTTSIDEIQSKSPDTVTVAENTEKTDDEWHLWPQAEWLKMYRPLWMRDHLPVIEKSMPMLPPAAKHFFSIHGIYRLPPGYRFAPVPSDAKIEVGPKNDEKDADAKIDVSYSYNFAKTALALLQTVSAGATLYRTRGNQIAIYGYSAFGLTVAPYLVMSIVNGLAQMVMPQYPRLYMVWSSEMDEAKKRGGHFDSIIGRLSDPKETSTCTATFKEIDGSLKFSITEKSASDESVTEQVDSSDSDDILIPPCSHFILEHSQISNELGEKLRRALSFHTHHEGKLYEKIRAQSESMNLKRFIAFTISPIAVVGLVSVAIIGALTGFRHGQSTRAQRAWILLWFSFGAAFGSLGPTITRLFVRSLERKGMHKWFGLVTVAITFGLFFVPAIGGFVVVIQMLNEYGTCIRP